MRYIVNKCLFDCRNMYLQDTILKKIDEMLKKFDAELRLLRHDKFKYDIMMKNADLRYVVIIAVTF